MSQVQINYRNTHARFEEAEKEWQTVILKGEVEREGGLACAALKRQLKLSEAKTMMKQASLLVLVEWYGLDVEKFRNGEDLQWKCIQAAIGARRAYALNAGAQMAVQKLLDAEQRARVAVAAYPANTPQKVRDLLQDLEQFRKDHVSLYEKYNKAMYEAN